MKRLGSNYWKLWTASVVSNFGDGVSTVAYPWLASAITRDPVQISLVAVATRLPWLVFSLPAGVITDRVDRRRLIAVMDTVRFAITIGVAVFVTASAATLSTPGGSPGWHLAVLYGAALSFGFAEVLRDNAAQTLMPAVVDRSLLEKANGRLWGAEMVMNSFVGPPVGGLLIAVAFAFPFWVDAGTFAAAALLITTIAGSFRTERATDAPRPGFRTEIAEGVKWLWKHRLLRTMAIVLGLMNAMFSLSIATYVLFVQEILHLDAAAFGVLMSAGALGGVVGSVTAPRISKAIGQGASLFTTIAIGSITALVTGLTSSAVLVWSMFVISSFSAVLWNVITVSLRQTIIPDQLLGRVNSVYRFFAWGMMPIGSLLGGVVVAAAEPFVGRQTALRMPFWVAAGVFAVLYVYSLPNLNSARITAALAEVDAVPTEEPSAG